MNQPAASLHIFQAGTLTSVDGRRVTITPEIVREIAESYDAANNPAPFVVGHPQLDDPARGWAKSLRAESGLLFAEPDQVEPQFASDVNAGRFKRVSSSIYMPGTPGNPKPGKHYLKHIGFLGAAAPSDRRIPPAQFAEGEGDGPVEFAQPISSLGYTIADIFQRLRDLFIERDGVEAAERLIPQWSIRHISEITQEPNETIPASFAEPILETTMSTDQAAALAEREQTLISRDTSITARETAINAREAAARRSDAVSFAEQLATAGKILPREQASVVELILALPADTALSFAEGDTTVSKPAVDVLRTLLTDLPKRLDFSEKSGERHALAALAFAAPPGEVVDTGRSDLHARAKAYQSEHPETSYVAAVRAVGG